MRNAAGHDADVIVIGAGAAGMMCAAVAGQRGLRVLLVDHAHKLGEKIRISGGGRCNFTNIGTTVEQFNGRNPAFARSALSRYTPRDFLDLLRRHGVGWEEKHRGQLFCRERGEAIIDVLRAECDAGRVQWRMPCRVEGVRRVAETWAVDTEAGVLQAPQLVIATGGLPVPAIGATDFGLRVARQFGLEVIEVAPALVPLTFDPAVWAPFASLSGVALPVRVSTVPAGSGRKPKPMQFDEDLLLTHRGLSGPAILQISSYWRAGEPLHLDLAAGMDLAAELLEAKRSSRQQLGTVLGHLLPRRLADAWLALDQGHPPADARLADLPDRRLQALADSLTAWRLQPSGTEGWKKAEVMRGGVSVAELDQQTMACKRLPGLHFIGEVVDITGWLGGYNFQWAWASAAACGRSLVSGRLAA